MLTEKEEAEMLNTHQTVINDNILPRLQSVEESQESLRTDMKHVKEDMRQVQHGQTQLENTVMRDGSHTRALLDKVVDHLADSGTTKANNETEIKIKKMETREKIIVGSLSALFGGGVLAGIIAAIVTLF